MLGRWSQEIFAFTRGENVRDKVLSVETLNHLLNFLLNLIT
jgi:hypothetical protein